jgi:hypothetical protein
MVAPVLNLVVASGGLGAGAIGAPVAAIAVIEAVDELGAADGGRALVPQDFLHLIAPDLSFLGPAKLAEVVDGAEDLGQPHQLAVIGAVVRGRRNRALSGHDGRQIVAWRLRLGRPRLRASLGLVEPPEKLGLGDRGKGHARPTEAKRAEGEPQEALFGLSHRTLTNPNFC